MTTASDQLQKLVTPDAYQAERAHLFPSKTSLQWFIRTRRADLVQANALLRLGGRVIIDAEVFDRAVLAIGRQQIQPAESVA